MLRKLVKSLIELTPYTIVRQPNNDGSNSSGLLHNTPEHMNDLFGNKKFLERYESLDRRKLYSFICSLFPESFEAVADFGCGPGFFLEYVSDKFQPQNLYGYEYSSTACEIARDRCPVATIVEHDLSHPIVESFDVIVCSQTLEHVHYPDIVLSNIAAACKDGGLIILTVPDGRVDTYKGHINFWSPESWKIWIESHFKEGFSLTFSTLPKSSGFSFLIAAVHRGR